MKNVLLIAFILIFSSVVFSQIKIDTTCYPKPGTSVKAFLLDTTNIKALVDIHGPNKVWDFSDRLKGEFYSDYHFQVSTKISQSSSFPGANLAVDSSNQDSIIKFYQSDSKGIYFLGRYSYRSSVLNKVFYYNEPSLLYKLPLSYGDSITNIAKALSFNKDGTKKSSFTNISKVSVDSWGIIKLPDAVELEVLRAKIVEENYDSIYNAYYDTWTLINKHNYISYQWLSNNTDFAIQTNIRIDSINKNVMVGYFKNSKLLSNIPAPEKSNRENISVIPNPVKDIVQIKLLDTKKRNVKISLFDMFGRSVLEETFREIDEPSLNLSNFPAGVYTILIQKENKQWSEKITIE